MLSVSSTFVGTEILTQRRFIVSIYRRTPCFIFLSQNSRVPQNLFLDLIQSYTRGIFFCIGAATHSATDSFIQFYSKDWETQLKSTLDWIVFTCESFLLFSSEDYFERLELSYYIYRSELSAVLVSSSHFCINDIRVCIYILLSTHFLEFCFVFICLDVLLVQYLLAISNVNISSLGGQLYCALLQF